MLPPPYGCGGPGKNDNLFAGCGTRFGELVEEGTWHVAVAFLKQKQRLQNLYAATAWASRFLLQWLSHRGSANVPLELYIVSVPTTSAGWETRNQLSLMTSSSASVPNSGFCSSLWQLLCMAGAGIKQLLCASRSAGGTQSCNSWLKLSQTWVGVLLQFD